MIFSFWTVIAFVDGSEATAVGPGETAAPIEPHNILTIEESWAAAVDIQRGCGGGAEIVVSRDD
jgi:hypothetical protein